MTIHRFNSTCRVSILSIVALSLAIFALPAGAQNVRVAQREDAGESASDDPADADELTVYPDAQDEEGEVLSPEEQAAALDQRGGEQVVDDPNNLAMILGMHVQEADSGRVKVVDVAAGSPAFESGVREGDEIASFDGFKAESYREWIDGIRRLVTDTPDGSAVSVELMRGDERITAEIRTPEAKADDVRRLGPLGQQITGQQVQGQGTVPPTGANQPFAPGVISDNDVFVNDSGFFADDLAGTTDRAVAEIFRITPQQTAPEQTAPQQTAPLNPPNQPSGQAATAAAATGQRTPPNAARARQNSLRPNNPGVGGASRIGMAGFRDDTNGMIVMLDVGGLAPGTYPVGIEDAGLILGGQQPMRSARNTQAPERDVRSQERMNRVRRPFDRQRTNSLQLDNPPANAPRPRPQLRQAPRRGSGNQDQSQTQSTPSIPRNVLAQVTNENSGSGTATPPTGQVQPNLTPPTGEVNPNLTPPTGEVNPNLTAPTGEANPNLTPPTGQVLPPGAPPMGRVLPSGTSPTGQPDPDAVGDEGLVGLDDSDIASVNPLSGSTLALVGMLTVDQSGTGRMQQVVEGVRVRDVVGQAIVIYAPATPPTTTVPPNTNVSGTRGETATAAATAQQEPGNVPGTNVPGTNVPGTNVPGTNVPGTNVPGTNQPRQLPGATPQQLATTGPITGAGTPTPVAAGVIRLMSDRRPNVNAPNATGATGRQNQRVQQPATARQPADAVTRPVQTPNQ